MLNALHLVQSFVNDYIHSSLRFLQIQNRLFPYLTFNSDFILVLLFRMWRRCRHYRHLRQYIWSISKYFEGNQNVTIQILDIVIKVHSSFFHSMLLTDGLCPTCSVFCAEHILMICNVVFLPFKSPLFNVHICSFFYIPGLNFLCIFFIK